MPRFFQDVRFALRQARRYPRHCGLILFILALGIGVNCAIFGKISQTLFRPLASLKHRKIKMLDLNP
jgi:hypothetical protein